MLGWPVTGDVVNTGSSTVSPVAQNRNVRAAGGWAIAKPPGIAAVPESSQMAEAAARQAIRLDPRNATAHAMLAWTFGHQGEWVPALVEADAAINLNANDPWGYVSKGHNLIYSSVHSRHASRSRRHSSWIHAVPPLC
jgi:hypothetical protein